mgnify:CR=1 FL=1|jgi:hypothetical protein
MSANRPWGCPLVQGVMATVNLLPQLATPFRTTKPTHVKMAEPERLRSQRDFRDESILTATDMAYTLYNNS